MRKRGIRKSVINNLINGLVRARIQALRSGSTRPNTYKILGRTDYYIYNKLGQDRAYVTAVFYDGHFESVFIDFTDYNGAEERELFYD